MELTTLGLFILTFSSVLILPGPNAAFAVGQSVRFGALSALVVPLGFMSATGLHAFFVFSGIGLVVQEFSGALTILKWLGFFYLLYLSYKSFISKPSAIEVSSQDISQFKMYFSAVFVSLTNPKALLASLMIFPLFLRPEYNYLTQSVILSLSAMAISFSVYGSYCLAATALRSRLAGARLANKIIGSMYLGAAGALVMKTT